MDSWGEAIAAYMTWLTASGSSPQTRRLRSGHLRRLAKDYSARSPWRVTQQQLTDWLAQPHWKPETRKSARGSVRSFYGWAYRTGRIAASPAEGLAGVRVPPAHPRPTPAPVVAQALAKASDRDRLMILLALLAGLRRGEIAAVHTRDVVDDLLGQTLVVRGKGGKVRHVPLHPALSDLLARVPDGYVFPGRDHGHLCANHVGWLLGRLLGPGWSAHTLRHKFACEAYRAQRDLRAIQELLGHASVSTTQRYVAVPDDAKRAAVLSIGAA